MKVLAFQVHEELRNLWIKLLSAKAPVYMTFFLFQRKLWFQKLWKVEIMMF